MNTLCPAFSPCTSDDAKRIATLAQTIWTHHYTPIIGAAQVAYMLSTLQSESTIRGEIENGSLQYFLVRQAGADLGYFAICADPQATQTMLLSKIYILPTCQGTGLGYRSFLFVEQQAYDKNHQEIRLFVNRKNHRSIAAYQRWGLNICGEILKDIGGNFQMDDFIMNKTVTPKTKEVRHG